MIKENFYYRCVYTIISPPRLWIFTGPGEYLTHLVPNGAQRVSMENEIYDMIMSQKGFFLSLKAEMKKTGPLLTIKTNQLYIWIILFDGQRVVVIILTVHPSTWINLIFHIRTEIMGILLILYHSMNKLAR